MRFRLKLIILTLINLYYLKNDDKMFIDYKEKRIIIKRLLIEA